MNPKNSGPIVVAGANGRLGQLVIAALVRRGAHVRAIVRDQATYGSIRTLRDAGAGVEIIAVDYSHADELADACSGGVCVVSTLAGLGDVIVTAQSRLLDAAVRADVQRFIPSDFSIDFTKLPAGDNRNLDHRRTFKTYLDQAPIRATSILNGMFAELLRGQAPIVLLKRKRVVYWENADQKMDFTTMANTAEYTAAAAMDPATPRFLRIAGDVMSARDLAGAALDVTGNKFKLTRAGGISRLNKIIRIARTLFPAPNDTYPPWQGMQYLRDMFDGRGLLEPLDNNRYPDIRWTKVREVLSAE